MHASEPGKTTDVIGFGESMALLSADTPGDLSQVAHFTRRLAGADSNVAIGLSRLGFKVHWISRVGADAFGRFIIEALATEGLDCQGVKVDSRRPTGIQFKSRSDEGSDPETQYYRSGSAATALAPDDLPASCFTAARHLHCTGIPAALSESARALCHHAMECMREAGGTISFDPNLRPALWASESVMVREINGLAAKADWVLPGEEEAKILTGSCNVDAIADFYLGTGAKEVIIKLGSRGAAWRSADNRMEATPAPPVPHVVDTVGAGDGFAVGFISARLDGLSVEAALKRANAVGARVIQHPGDNEGLPNRFQLQSEAVL